MDTSFVLIVNPHAGGGKVNESLDDVTRFFYQHGIVLEVVYTQCPHDPIERIPEIVGSGKTQIISLGGDGTTFDIMNGVLQNDLAEHVQLGIIPLGTGNDFLRDFDIVSWKDSAQRIIRGQIQKFDVGKIAFLDQPDRKPLFFHNVAGFGLIAEACRLRHNRYHFLGRFGYQAAFFQILFHLSHYHVTWNADWGGEKHLQTPLLAVCNSQFTGHGEHISPRSRTQDGLMEFLYVEDIGSMEIISLFLQVPTGAHLEDPSVHMVKFTQLDLELKGLDYFMVDGEVMPAGPMRIAVVPQALKMFI